MAITVGVGDGLGPVAPRLNQIGAIDKPEVTLVGPVVDPRQVAVRLELLQEVGLPILRLVEQTLLQQAGGGYGSLLGRIQERLGLTNALGGDIAHDLPHPHQHLRLGAADAGNEDATHSQDEQGKDGTNDMADGGLHGPNG